MSDASDGVPPWSRLCEQFLALASSERTSSRQVWLLFTRDEWYRGDVSRRARRVLAGSGAPAAWQEDVEHEVYLALEVALRRRPDLGVHRERVQRCFRAWLRRHTDNACRNAICKLRRLYRSGGPLPEELPARRSLGEQRLADLRVELRSILDGLPDPERTLLSLYADGRSAQEIARRLGLPHGTVWRRIGKAIVRLRAEWADHHVDRPTL
jgi:RNA polymerase sigma factor (sigma-70 family)